MAARPSNRPPIKVHRLIEKAMWETEGVSPERLQDMLARSVRFTHPDGNRRHLDYVFRIEGNVLYSVRKARMVTDEIVALDMPEKRVVQHDGVRVNTVSMADMRQKAGPAILQKSPREYLQPGTVQCPECEGKGTVTVMDPCDNCAPVNDGCEQCDEGLVARTIRCPVCLGEKRIKPDR